MSEKKADYSDYITAVSNLSNVRAILTGFTFTVITLLLIELPDPSQTNAQIVLFTLTLLVDMFLYTIFVEVMETFRSIGKVPPWRFVFSSITITAESSLHDVLTYVSVNLWGITIALMFLLWNLTLLALITGVIHALLMTLAYFRSFKPVAEHLKKACHY